MNKLLCNIANRNIFLLASKGKHESVKSAGKHEPVESAGKDEPVKNVRKLEPVESQKKHGSVENAGKCTNGGKRGKRYIARSSPQENT